MSWAPFKSGKTSLRGSFGMFYDWLSANIYEQSLRVNGFRQRELNIANPSFPDPGSAGTISTTNRYLLSEDLPMARNTRVSAGVDQTISPRVRAGFTYAHTTGTGLMRGENLNFPINGVRPDPLFVNIIRVVNDAASRQDVLNAFGSFSLTPQTPSMMGPFECVRTALELEAHVVQRELLDRPAREQHRRPVQPPGERIAGRRVGAGSRRDQEASFQHWHQHERAQEPEREHQFQCVNGDALHRYDRPRRQRRSGLQRSSGWRGTQYRSGRLGSGPSTGFSTTTSRLARRRCRIPAALPASRCAMARSRS